MFKKQLIAAWGALGLAATAMATEWCWDFRASSRQLALPGELRGKSQFAPAGLVVGLNNKKAQGFKIRHSEKVKLPGGFKLTAEFICGVPTHREDIFLLWDSKGYPYEKKPDEIKRHKVHRGFMLGFRRLPLNEYIPMLWLGYETQMAVIYGKPVVLKPSEKHRLSCTFDGANQVEFQIDGELNSYEPVFPGGTITPAYYSAVIGDRVMSGYKPFNATITQLTLTALPSRLMGATLVGRRAFSRGEKNSCVTVQLNNYTRQPLKNLQLMLKSSKFPAVTRQVAELAPGAVRYETLPVETRLTPGTYSVELQLSAVADGKTIQHRIPNYFMVGPEKSPVEIPVVCWGYIGTHRTLQKLGLTHATTQGFMNLSPRHVETERPLAYFQPRMDYLDRMLQDGFAAFDSIEMRNWNHLFPRYDRSGKVRRLKNVEASNPAAVKLAAQLAAKTGEVFGAHPALTGVLINSELRDRTAPSFGKYEPQAFKKFAGFDIPADIDGKIAPDYRTLRNFPLNRIVPDNDPRLVFFRWFWKTGDGWNNLNSVYAREYTKTLKRHFWTFHDPAVRVPPIWGSGGRVNYISHWTYPYPDPFRVATVTDECLAMAQGQPGQQVMTMTQLIFKRHELMPGAFTPAQPPAWPRKYHMDSYGSVPPDALQEAVWAMIARPVTAVMFHGINAALVLNRGRAGYKMTNPALAVQLEKSIKQVLRPLGPILPQLKVRPREIGLFQSFTSAMYAGRGTWGWLSWSFDANLMLHWAKLTPEILYEEHLKQGALNHLKVLVMPHCDVLSVSSYQAIQAFQRRGGIVIADEYLAPGLTPNIRINSWARYQKTNGLVAKRALQKMGEDLRRQLKKYYQIVCDSTNPDLLVYPAQNGQGDYLFVLNDRRTYGNYVGPWRQMAEQGVKNSGAVTLKRAHTQAVYDLLRHCSVPFSCAHGTTRIPVNFSTNDGKLLLLLDSPITRLVVQTPKRISAGATQKIAVQIWNRAGQKVPAAVPVELTLTAPTGQTTVLYYRADHGELQLNRVVALNDAPGQWQVQIKELASGLTQKKSFEVIKAR